MITNEEINKIKQMVYYCIKNDRYAEDLTQEVCIMVLELGETKIKDLRSKDELYSYIYGIIRNQFKSRNSKFYAKIRKYDEKKSEIKYKHLQIGDGIY